MSGIDDSVLAQLPLDAIGKVTFYKRDEITTDLICCEVQVGDKSWTFHEELAGWDALLEHMEQLPNFQNDWFGAVSQPPFATDETVAFNR